MLQCDKLIETKGLDAIDREKAKCVPPPNMPQYPLSFGPPCSTFMHHPCPCLDPMHIHIVFEDSVCPLLYSHACRNHAKQEAMRMYDEQHGNDPDMQQQ